MKQPAVFKKITPCASPTRKIPTDIAPPLSCGTVLGPDTSNSGKKDIKTEEIKKGIMRED